MEKTLLEKSRSINKALQNSEGNRINFSEICATLSENLESTVFIVGRRGQINGFAFHPNSACTNIESLIHHVVRFPESFNQEFAGILETRTNISLEKGRTCLFNNNSSDCDCSERSWSVIPIYGGAKRVGTLVLMRKQTKQFAEEDIVLAEYSAIVIANVIMRMIAERIEEQALNKAAVQIALATLSHSEKGAIQHIIGELDGNAGLLVASRIADEAGITRSVIVNALRKLETAGIIESRSQGMKGTYIKVLNQYLVEEIRRQYT